MESYSVLYSSSHRTTLLSGFQQLRTKGKMCDVVLEAGGVSFPCHRALLASSSEYFRALFGDATAERFAERVGLPALTSEGLDAILDFLYSGWLSVSAAALPVVLEAARYLQVDTAVSICERFITDGLRADNCCFYANLAAYHALPASLEAANCAIALEMGGLLRDRRDHLLGLNMESLMTLLDAEEIPGVKEAELLKLALDWLDENGPLPLLRSNLLLSRLRFGLIAPADLGALSHAHPAMATPLIRSQLTRALEYHGAGPAQPVRQSKQSALRAPADRVLLVGGGSRPDRPETEMLMFEPGSRKFSSVGSRVPLRLRGHCVCSVGGFVFVIGGEAAKEVPGDGESFAMETSNQVWRYDPRFQRWEKMEAMLERRTQFSCCVVEDVIYAIGGKHPLPGGATHTVEFYDMATGAWRRGTPLPRPLHGHAAAALDGAIYVSGGLPGGNGITRSGNQDDDAGGERRGGTELLHWGPKARVWEKRAPMAIGRFGHRLVTIGGFIYALLGMFEPFCDIERYDAQADHWTRLRPLLIGSFGYGMASVPLGSLLVFGGRRWTEGQEVVVKSVLEYDARRDEWREICQLPRPLTGLEAAALPLPD